jgi:hypothetical protein
MEVPQGNSLCSNLKKPKISFISSFLIQNWRTGRKNMLCLGGWRLVPVRWEEMGNGEGG